MLKKRESVGIFEKRDVRVKWPLVKNKQKKFYWVASFNKFFYLSLWRTSKDQSEKIQNVKEFREPDFEKEFRKYGEFTFSHPFFMFFVKNGLYVVTFAYEKIIKT